MIIDLDVDDGGSEIENLDDIVEGNETEDAAADEREPDNTPRSGSEVLYISIFFVQLIEGSYQDEEISLPTQLPSKAESVRDLETIFTVLKKVSFVRSGQKTEVQKGHFCTICQ